MFCMVVTPMHADGRIDEDGFRAHLRRMVAGGVGVYLGSGGSGEGHALTLDELGLLYGIGVDECKGKVPVYCNPPEARSAREMLDKATRALDAGVDLVQLYQLDAGHGRMPVLAEQEKYYRDLLETVDSPVAISVHSAVGYLAPASMVIGLCADYPQIKVINLHGPSMAYFVRLKDGVSADVKLYVGMADLLSGLALGAWGAQATEPNQLPNLCRVVVERFSAGDVSGSAAAYADVLRATDIIGFGRAVSADGPKAAMKALGFDVGPPRPPRVAVDDGTIEKMRGAFEAMHALDLEGEAAQERAPV
jgi:4-hydroxy-tetrahydrodipicolinate synthase